MNTITLHHGKAYKNTTIKWVDEVWHSDSIITNEIVSDSFKYAGISSELDGSETTNLESMKIYKKGTKL